MEAVGSIEINPVSLDKRGFGGKELPSGGDI